MLEAFLAIQAMYGLENSDLESVRSDISETLGALSFQRRPGSGRRKKQVPLRSPWDASVSTESVPQESPQEQLRSRLGLSNDGEASDPATPTFTAVADSAVKELTPVRTPSMSTPNSTSRNKKNKQDLAGPCCHCSATNSPQWRKGPKGKPILCNACGIRFLRTRTLGKAVPKKRRQQATASVSTAGGVEFEDTHNKRIRTDEPSTEEDEYDGTVDEAVAMDSRPASTDLESEETHSNSEDNIDLSFRRSAGRSTAAAAAVRHQTRHSQRHRITQSAALPTSRLAIASSALREESDNTTSATEAAAEQAEIYQQPYGVGHSQIYNQPCGQTYGQTAVDQVLESHNGQLAEQYTGSAAAAVDLVDLVPQYEWSNLSVHPWGPHAAVVSGQDAMHHPALLLGATAAQSAAAAAANHSSDFASSDMTSVAAGVHQPLAAGSRLLLGASSGGSSSSSRLVQSPSLALALAMHQQQSSSSYNPPQQQQQQLSPGKGLGPEYHSSIHRSGCSGSPMSHSSAFPSHLRAEYSGFSLASGSPPASPLTLGAAAIAAAAGAGSSGFSRRVNEGFGGEVSTQLLQQYQQQQHGMHRSSPLSVMATAADLAQHAATSARQFHAGTSAQHHADLAPQNADLAAAEAAAAAAANVQQATGVDVLQLMRHMASALGGVGPTWNLLQSLQNGGGGGPNAAAAAALGLINSACLMQQQ